MDAKYNHLRKDKEFLAALFYEGLDIFDKGDEDDVNIIAELWTQDFGELT